MTTSVSRETSTYYLLVYDIQDMADVLEWHRTKESRENRAKEVKKKGATDIRRMTADVGRELK